MGHLVLILAVITLGLGWWLAVHYSPRVLSMVLPRNFSFAVGGFFFVTGVFGAFVSAYVTGDPGAFLSAMVNCFVGGWFLLAPTAALRGSIEDVEMMKTLGVMLAALVAVMLLLFYVRTPHGLATLTLWLVLFGGALTERYLNTHSS